MNRTLWMQIGFALAAVLIATLLRWLLQPVLGDRLAFMIFFVPLILSAWYGGLWGGLTALAASTAAVLYFLGLTASDGPIEPYNWIGLVLFVLVGIIFSGICESMQAARRRVEQHVRAALQERERWEVTLESIGDGVIVTDTAGRVTFLNPVAQRLTGWTMAEAEGRPLADVFRIVDERSREVSALPAAAALESGHVIRLPDHSLLISKDGREHAVDDSAAPITDELGQNLGCVLVFRDVSAERHAERALRASEERFRTMADASPVLIWMTGPDAKANFFNRPWLEFTGGTLEEHLGDRWTNFVHPEDAAYALETFLTAFEARELLSMEYRLRRQDGEYRWVYDHGAPIYDEQQKFIGYIGSCVDISEQKRVELALIESNKGKDEALALLKDSEEKFRLMSDSIPQLAWMAQPDGYVLWFNQRWYDFTGTTPEEMEGEAWQSVHDPKELPRVLKSWRSTIASGQPWECTFPLRRHDGAMIWHLTRAMPLKDGEGNVIRWFGTNTDISERRKTERTLQFLADVSEVLSSLVDYRSSLQKVARLAIDGFADWCAIDMVQSDGSIRRVALANADPAKEAWGLNLFEVTPPTLDDAYGAGLVLRNGMSQLVESVDDNFCKSVAKSPEHLEFLRDIQMSSYICVPLKAHGKTLGSMAFALSHGGQQFDKDDLQVAEDLAHRTTIAIENARLYQEIQSADRRKDEFLAMLAHELRNPLAPIRTGLEILAMEKTGESELIDVMQDQVRHLARLVDDLLDVSRIVRGKIELRQDKVELSTIVRQVVRTTKPLIEAQSQQLSVRIPEEPIWLHADSVRISQVLGNLLNNASKYTDQGGQISLTAQPEGNMVEIQIADNGIGIDQELLPKVFDLFSQSSRSLDRAQGGLGIGLTLVKNLVELHRGTVTAFSDGPAQGSRFVVRLPMTTPPQQAHDAEAVNPESVTRRILVVDDSIGAAKMLAKLLSKLDDHVVETVHDGLQVHDSANRFRPDIIFLDIGLPGMDGYEVAKALRSDATQNGVLLVALTGYGQEEDRRKSREVGFDEHLVKPPALDDIKRVLVHPKLTGRTGI